MATETPTASDAPVVAPVTASTRPGVAAGQAVTVRGIDPLTGIGASWTVSPVERVEAGSPLFRVEWVPELAQRSPWVLARRTTALVTQREAESLVARLESV